MSEEKRFDILELEAIKQLQNLINNNNIKKLNSIDFVDKKHK